MPKIAYSAVVLELDSQLELKRFLEKEYPQLKGWTVYCHHMTIRMGELPKEMKKRLGEEVELQVQFVGRTDKAAAVRVNDVLRLSSSTHPHVTLAVNPDGGKPVMSNYITTWSPVFDEVPLILKGKIEEVPAK